MEIRDEGLLLDTYLSSGLIPWKNLTAIGAVRALGVKYLGIAISDVDAYIASRRQTHFDRSFDRALAQGFFRFMTTVAPQKAVNTVLYLPGHTKLPDSPTEREILSWNQENMGYRILIQAFSIPNFDQTIDTISAAKTG